jgi:outer membrane protein insertion porin family
MFTGRGWSDFYREKGYTLIDSWIELRFPIVAGILAFDMFLDAAGIESMQGYYLGKDPDGNPNFTINNFRFSFGGGLRLTLPQLPIRLSLAKRFRFVDDKFQWVNGNAFGGLDVVLSFVLSY